MVFNAQSVTTVMLERETDRHTDKRTENQADRSGHGDEREGGMRRVNEDKQRDRKVNLWRYQVSC